MGITQKQILARLQVQTCPAMEWASSGHTQQPAPGGIQVVVRVQLLMMVMITVMGNEKEFITWQTL